MPNFSQSQSKEPFSIRNIPLAISSKILKFIFPPLCLHCHAPCERFICIGCSVYFELIDPYTRCRFCFVENEGDHTCSTCKAQKRWHLKIAGALDEWGPVYTTIKKLRSGSMPYLAKTMAAFMFLQFIQTKWERPDWIVPIPPSLLLAKELARFLKLPVKAYLKKKIDFNCEQPLYIKSHAEVEGKTILLIRDRMERLDLFYQANELFKQRGAKKVYALTFSY